MSSVNLLNPEYWENGYITSAGMTVGLTWDEGKAIADDAAVYTAYRLRTIGLWKVVNGQVTVTVPDTYALRLHGYDETGKYVKSSDGFASSGSLSEVYYVVVIIKKASGDKVAISVDDLMNAGISVSVEGGGI